MKYVTVTVALPIGAIDHCGHPSFTSCRRITSRGEVWAVQAAGDTFLK
jgi:hypothetical protein